jgi:trimeric autotransporter adhesin
MKITFAIRAVTSGLALSGALLSQTIPVTGVPVPELSVFDQAMTTLMNRNVTVEYKGVASTAVALNVSAAAPSIFTFNAAARGSVVAMFGTGEGQTDPPGVTGLIANGPKIPAPLLRVGITVGGIPAAIAYAGGAPQLVAGLFQVNFQIPDGAPSGAAVPVVLTIGDVPSQLVTMAIR